MQKYRVKLTFTEPLLGTAPGNKELYGDFIAEKAEVSTEDEMLTVPEQIEKGSTGFHRLEDGTPILYDYAIKGFFKDACGMLSRASETGSSKLRAYRKVIDGLVFVHPRRIPLQLSGETDWLERPLRAQTAQGERVALARSEMAPVESTLEFTVLILGQVSKSLLEEWLVYGALRGLGQWRNGSYGRFDYELEKLD